MNKIEKKINEFREFFSIDRLNKITIDEYVIGNDRKDTFCYRIERDLICAGDIRGANAKKFGVYYGKYGSNNTKDYVYAYRFKDDFEKGNFEKVRKALIKLISETKKLTEFTDIKSDIHGMFKYKIMFIYNSQIMIPSYFIEDVRYFAESLDIKCGDNYEEYQRALLKYKKQKHPNMSNLSFMQYLYKHIGKPVNRIDIKYDNELNEKTYCKALKEKEINDIGNHPIDNKRINGVAYYPRDPKQMRIALSRANGICENDKSHKSFIRKNGEVYLECHHLVPMCYYDKFDKSIDVASNIVCLCSECHNKIHYGIDYKKLVKKLYKDRKEELKECNINIEEKRLIEMYEYIYKIENE